MNSKALESFLIPKESIATEGLFNKSLKKLSNQLPNGMGEVTALHKYIDDKKIYNKSDSETKANAQGSYIYQKLIDEKRDDPGAAMVGMKMIIHEYHSPESNYPTWIVMTLFDNKPDSFLISRIGKPDIKFKWNDVVINARKYSKASESFSSDSSIVTEDLFDGIINVTNFILTPLYKIGDYNENKDKRAEAKLRDEQRKKQLQEEINNLVTLNKRYHFLDSESNYNKHIKNAHAFADKKIHQYVNLANKDAKAFAELRSKVLKAYGDDVASEPLFKSLKPGYFTCQDEWDYWVIIPDQDIALCCELHWNIAEKLNTLNDPNLTFVSFSNGDGDEGCVYFNYLPYNIVFERYPGLKTALKESN